MVNEQVNHPNHYGGETNPYEAIKVIDAWDLGFSLGNTVKYISRAGKKESDKELNSNINNIIRMIQNYYRQETSQVNKKNVAKYFYNIVDNKLRGTISYQYMTKILKWSLNNISKKTQI